MDGIRSLRFLGNIWGDWSWCVHSGGRRTKVDWYHLNNSGEVGLPPPFFEKIRQLGKKVVF
jgi:hypothetical protein